MRRILLILMIALLPVRGWASDVMSVAHAAQQLNTTEFIATHALQTRATAIFYGYFEVKSVSSMPWDCPMAAGDVASGAADVTDVTDVISAAQNRSGNRLLTPKSLCHGCGTCQLCMALATSMSLPVFDASTATYPVPLPHNSGFSSATLPPGFKPPIS